MFGLMKGNLIFLMMKPNSIWIMSFLIPKYKGLLLSIQRKILRWVCFRGPLLYVKGLIRISWRRKNWRCLLANCSFCSIHYSARRICWCRNWEYFWKNIGKGLILPFYRIWKKRMIFCRVKSLKLKIVEISIGKSGNFTSLNLIKLIKN